MADRSNAQHASVLLATRKTDAGQKGARPLAWEDWRKRGIVPLGFAVLLAHNVRPSESALKRLREAGDSRVDRIMSDRHTASLRMLMDKRLSPINGAAVAARHSERLRQKVHLPQFVSWAIELIEHPDMSEEFRAMGAIPSAPPSSIESMPDSWGRSLEILRAKYALRTATAVTKRLQSVAELVVAVAINRFGLEVDQAGETPNGTIAAFERITADAGFGQMDGKTISDALSLAVDLVGREKVLWAMAQGIAKPSR